MHAITEEKLLAAREVLDRGHQPQHEVNIASKAGPVLRALDFSVATVKVNPHKNRAENLKGLCPLHPQEVKRPRGRRSEIGPGNTKTEVVVPERGDDHPTAGGSAREPGIAAPGATAQHA